MYNLVVKDNPKISKSTVYRNISILLDKNIIRKVKMISGPDRYDYITNEMEAIVGAKAVDGVLFLTTDATFDSLSWFDWTHYGEIDLDDFVFILDRYMA